MRSMKGRTNRDAGLTLEDARHPEVVRGQEHIGGPMAEGSTALIPSTQRQASPLRRSRPGDDPRIVAG
jgi:hypothetical protein